MLTLSDDNLIKARKRIETAPHGERGAVLTAEATRLGVSVRTLQRKLLNLRGRRRGQRKETGHRKETDLERYTIIACGYQKTIQLAGAERALPMESAIRAAERDGRIPEGALKTSTANGIKRRLNITAKKKHVRITEPDANAVWQADGSGAEYLYFVNYLPDGDCEIAIRADKKKTGKNPRVNAAGEMKEAERLLVYYYGFMDGYSRAAFADVVVAAGENFEDAARAFQRAMERKADSPLVGLPDKLFTDSGPLGKNRAELMLREIGVELVTHTPYLSRAKGKIERFWRELWSRFELEFLLNRNRNIRLSELRAMLSNYLADYNARPHPDARFRNASRAAVYMASLQSREVRLYPEGVDILYYSPIESVRVIDGAGAVRLDKEYFEIIDCPASLIGEKTLVRKFPDRVEVRNPQTKAWLRTKSFAPVMFGDHRAFKSDINDEIEEAAEARESGGLSHRYEARSEEDDGGVRPILRGKEIALEREEERREPPLRSMIEALIFFADESKYAAHEFEPDIEKKIREFLEENMRDRAKVRDMARRVGKIWDDREYWRRKAAQTGA